MSAGSETHKCPIKLIKRIKWIKEYAIAYYSLYLAIKTKEEIIKCPFYCSVKYLQAIYVV